MVIGEKQRKKPVQPTTLKRSASSKMLRHEWRKEDPSSSPLVEYPDSIRARHTARRVKLNLSSWSYKPADTFLTTFAFSFAVCFNGHNNPWEAATSPTASAWFLAAWFPRSCSCNNWVWHITSSLFFDFHCFNEQDICHSVR